MTLETLAPAGPRPMPGTPGPRAESRRVRGFVAVAVVAALAVVAATAGWWVLRPGRTTVKASCVAVDGAVRFRRPLEQVALASDLAAVGVRLGLPDHAITVVLATAMQESGLRNLPGGDRDSVGVLQQRPSQGWGTRAQILDPSYAATAFYRRLQQVPSWERLDVTAAAQAVQHSGRPDAYRQWEPEARAMAKAFTGESGPALSCQGVRPGRPLPAARVMDAATAALGQPRLRTTVTPGQGWTAATWLMAHAGGLGVTGVSFAGEAWTAGQGAWKPSAPPQPEVTFTPA